MSDIPYRGNIGFIQQRWSDWLDKHIKPEAKVVLDQKRIYIFPTKEGLFFLITVLALFFGGVNYQNSLILAMSFFLTGLFCVGIYHTYRNLSGLIIEASHVEPCFVGEKAAFFVNLSSAGSRPYECIRLTWSEGAEQICRLVEEREVNAMLFVDTQRRGWLKPGRLKIYTVYPIGLIRAWTWVDLGFECLVYPQPLENREVKFDAISQETGKNSGQAGVDDFEGLKLYRPGDPLKHVHWKVLAQSDQLFSKTFSSEQQEKLWLDWSSFTATDIEQRLSFMCYWVLQLWSQDQVFGLRLPGAELVPDKGSAHKSRCLATLATFGLNKQPLDSQIDS